MRYFFITWMMSICFSWTNVNPSFSVHFEFKCLFVSIHVTFFMEITVFCTPCITICPLLPVCTSSGSSWLWMHVYKASSQSGRLLGVPDSECTCIKHMYKASGRVSVQLPLWGGIPATKIFYFFFRHRIFDLRKEGRFLPSSFIKASVFWDQFTSALRWACIACRRCFLSIRFRLLCIYWRFLSSFFTEYFVHLSSCYWDF